MFNEILNNLTQKYLSMMEIFDISKLSEDDFFVYYEDLLNIIEYNNKLYYIYAHPVISDWEYDKLFDFLKLIESKYPEHISQQSPTQKMIGQLQDQFLQAKHLVAMLSLENTYNAQDLIDWNDFLIKGFAKNEINNWSYFVETKYDGSSIELVYKNGKFVQAITRGDGNVGEDITENVKMVKFVPQKLNIDENIDEIRVRGEIVLPKNMLENINAQRENLGQPLFANTRNAASGSLRQLDSSETAKRGLVCFVYDLLFCSIDLKLNTQQELINWFHQIGFNVGSFQKKCLTIDEVVNICENVDIKNQLEKENIEFDGLVIKINELKLREFIGTTGHHPRWAVAFKFPTKQVSTQLLNVDFQVGRTGAITPVANLKSIELGGVKISRASLHNFDYIKQKDIKIGDHVWIQRSGEVIPYIVAPIVGMRDGQEKDILPPKVCPVCGFDVSKFEDEVYLFCTNLSCSAVIKEQIKHFVSKNCMDIEGLGGQIIDMLVDVGLIKNFADLYKLGQAENRTKLISLPLMGEKRVNDIVIQIENSKKASLWRLLHALGIKHIGKKMAKVLQDNLYQSLNNNWQCFDAKSLISFLSDEGWLSNIYGIGKETIEFLKIYLSNSANTNMIYALENIGLKFNNFEIMEDDGKLLKGIRFSITGKFDIPREQIISNLEKFGAVWDEQPKKETNFILVGEQGGSKLDKAKQYGIKIINGLLELQKEYDFLKFTNTKPSNFQQIKGLFD